MPGVYALEWSWANVDVTIIIKEHAHGLIWRTNFDELFLSVAMLLMTTSKSDCIARVRSEIWGDSWLVRMICRQSIECKSSLVAHLNQNQTFMLLTVVIIAQNHLPGVGWWDCAIRVDCEPLITTFMAMINWNIIVLMVFAHCAIKWMLRTFSQANENSIWSLIKNDSHSSLSTI